VDETVTVPELIAEYRAKVQEVRHTIDEKLYAFGQDVEGPKLRALKAEVAKLRTELLAGPAARPGTANPIDSLGEYDQEYRRVILEAIPQTAVPGRLDRLAQAAERFRDAARAVDADKPTPQQVEQLKGLLVGVEEAVKTLNDAIQNLPEGEPKADVGPLLKTLSELGPVLPEASAASVNAGSGSAGTLFATLKSQVADLQKAYRHLSDLRSVLEQDEKTRGTLAAPGASPMLRFIDFTTRWGLVVVGWLLLIGLFSRPACVAGAAFLTMIYLSTPAFPWLPTPPNVEGHYLFVNKNVVELLALLALATTASGRWFGLDALLAWMSGRLRPATPRPIEAPPAPALPKKG
jgi:uncharacterized membrane protein YphA (DoxX/SURF4 family)